MPAIERRAFGRRFGPWPSVSEIECLAEGARGCQANRSDPAWRRIEQGRLSGDEDKIWLGNMGFAYHEQRAVVNRCYEMLQRISINGIPLIPVMSWMAESPVPGGRRFSSVADGPPNIAGFWGQRWKWITDDMWPKWRSLRQGERLRLTAMSLTEMQGGYE